MEGRSDSERAARTKAAAKEKEKREKELAHLNRLGHQVESPDGNLVTVSPSVKSNGRRTWGRRKRRWGSIIY